MLIETDSGKPVHHRADGTTGLWRSKARTLVDVHVRGAGKEDRELVTAEAGGEGAFGHLPFEALGETLEQRVAHLVTEPIVDLLEPVEVEQQERAGAVEWAVGLEQLGEAIGERHGGSRAWSVNRGSPRGRVGERGEPTGTRGTT